MAFWRNHAIYIYNPAPPPNPPYGLAHSSFDTLFQICTVVTTYMKFVSNKLIKIPIFIVAVQ